MTVEQMRQIQAPVRRSKARVAVVAEVRAVLVAPEPKAEVAP